VPMASGKDRSSQGQENDTRAARAARVQEATASLLHMFDTGDLPEKVAQTVIRRLETDTPAPSAKWSLGNQILMTLAGTVDARGFHQWHEVNRYVNKGAKAFYILAPIRIKKTEATSDGEEEYFVTIGFKPIPVFRYEDTHGDPLPQPNYKPAVLPPLFNVAQKYGVPVKWTPATERFRGVYNLHTKEITLCTHDVSVFFHELAHAVHATFRELKGGQNPDQEVVAETVSAVLCHMYGYDGYLWHCREYITYYAEAKDPGRAIMRVLGDVQKVLNLILDLSEGEHEGEHEKEKDPAA
jgi:hypothetical protein